MSSDFVTLFTGMSERDIGYLLKNIVQRSINTELTNTELSNVDNKTPVLITNSKDVELMNDIAIQSTINIETPTNYLMPEEPDGINLKLWVKFQNSGQLRDWSYQKNRAFAVGANTMPGLFYRSENNNMLKSELYSYFNGANHYGYVEDAAPVRILPNITTNKITSFFMRLKPLSLSRLLYAENNALFTKVDDDQLRYGYSVTIDLNGSIHFYVKNNYRQYYLFIKDAYNSLVSNPIIPTSTRPFRFENFNQSNFFTSYETLCNLVAQEPPFDDWFFKYNPTTHAMSVIKTVENNDSIVFADTSLVTPVPIISCPIQEGKYTHSGTVQTTVYDNSGNNNNGTINNIAVGGQWNDDNTLLNNGGNTGGTGGAIDISFPSISTINTQTEFTITFWFNPMDSPLNPNTYHEYIVYKEGSMQGDFWIERKPGTGTIDFTIRDSAGAFKTAIFTNAIVNPNTWYFIVCKWKSGENLKISINNSAFVQSSTTASLSAPNNTGTLKLFYQNRSPNGKIALFRYYITQISQTVQDDLYYQGYHNPLFPKSENIQPTVEEDPDPIFVPFSNVYTLDKMAAPVASDYRKINSLAGDNPLVSLYDVPDGTSTFDPEVIQYDVQDGIVTGGDETPFVRIGSAPNTIDSTVNSSGVMGDGQNDIVALMIQPTAHNGIGDTINGKVITKAIFYMRKQDATVTGTLSCKIWDAAHVLKYTFTNTISANSLPQTNGSASSFVAQTFTGTTNTFAMAEGWHIGVEYTGFGSGHNLDVQRLSSPPDQSAIQITRQVSGSEWDDDGNSSFSIKCDLYTGGTGSPLVDPNFTMQSGTGNYDRVVEHFGTGDPLIGKIPTKATFRLKKTGSPTGTLRCYLRNETGTILREFLPAINVATTLTTSTTDYTFTLLTNDLAVSSGLHMGVYWTPAGTGSIQVMSNKGVTDPHPPTGTNTNSYLRVFRQGGAGWVNTNTTLDVSGKIYTGGTTFDAYLRMSETRTRVATKSVNNQSSLHNDKITKVIARIKKVGTPAGIITARIRDPNDVEKVLFSSVDVSTIAADGVYHDVEFTNFTHTYLLNSATGSGDKVVYEFSGSTSTNYIEFNSNKDVFDSSNLATITQTYESGNYVDFSQRDLAGKMYTGGEPDLTSRTRVAQSIEHQNSRLKGKKITRLKAFLYRTNTSTSGTVYCNIRRGSDDSLVKTIGTVAASTLSTNPASPTTPTFTDTTNNYPLTVGDKVTIEFNGGTATNAVGVLVREITPTNYDGSYSYIRKYDEVDYDDSEITKDLCAVMDEGGFFFTPEPGFIPDPTPVNDKDLIICAGNNKVSGFLECFLMEFRIYAKDISLDDADNLYTNRYSISPIAANSVLMPLSLKANTLDPV